MMKLIKEPLLHFFLIGAAFFGLYTAVAPQTGSDKEIVISIGRIDTLSQQFQKTWNRQPNQSELQKLVDGFTLEEIYYRQAKNMGLDNNDPIIRRRLQQKMEFFTQSMLENLQPSDQVLTSFMIDNASDYRGDDRYSFEQIYINTDRSEKILQSIIKQMNNALAQNKPVAADTSLLPSHFNNISAFHINRQLGKGFAEKLDALELNHWSAPLQSGLGLHIVKLEKIDRGKLPALAQVRDTVERDWLYQQQQSTKQALDKQLLQDYEIEVQWPEVKANPELAQQ